MQENLTHAIVAKALRQCYGLQAVMLDIVVMLFVILQPYFPAEVRWSPFMNFYDIISFNTCMPAIVYCIFWALW